MSSQYSGRDAAVPTSQYHRMNRLRARNQWDDDGSYELPPVIKNIVDGWSKTANALAVASALLAGIEIQWITTIVSVSNTSSSPDFKLPSVVSQNALRTTAYLALFCDLSTVVCAFLMLDLLADVPQEAWMRSARTVGAAPNFGLPPIVPTDLGRMEDLVALWGSDRRWSVVKWSTWVFGSFGIVLSFVQPIVWLHIHEPSTVAVPCTIVGLLWCIPFGYYLFQSLSGYGKRYHRRPTRPMGP